MVKKKISTSLMIWGPPGVGKSSIVAAVAKEHSLTLIDLRLSQLAPTDLRGLPVAEEGRSRWFPPEFLPDDGYGILFLDEINMAPPAMQGVAQQLILDRRVGSYQVPPDWFIWAAGNRKEDYAAVFDMPAPLANRFLHLTVETDFESFRRYALSQGIHEQIIAFLAFRPALLHKVDKLQPSWPSPRSWVMASTLHQAGLDVTPAVGEGCGAEFAAFIRVYKVLPDLEAILQGTKTPIFPHEPSQRYAVTIGLTARSGTADQAYHGLKWLSESAPAEWVQLYISDILRLFKERRKLPELAVRIQKDAFLSRVLEQHRSALW